MIKDNAFLALKDILQGLKWLITPPKFENTNLGREILNKTINHEKSG